MITAVWELVATLITLVSLVGMAAIGAALIHRLKDAL